MISEFNHPVPIEVTFAPRSRLAKSGGQAQEVAELYASVQVGVTRNSGNNRAFKDALWRPEEKREVINSGLGVVSRVQKSS